MTAHPEDLARLRSDVLYPTMRRLLNGRPTFNGWCDGVRAALADEPAWLQLGDRSRERLLATVWADEKGQPGRKRWRANRMTEAEPWYRIVAPIYRGVARVSCPCGETHMHAPVSSVRRYAPCGRFRYEIELFEP